MGGAMGSFARKLGRWYNIVVSRDVGEYDVVPDMFEHFGSGVRQRNSSVALRGSRGMLFQGSGGCEHFPREL